MATPNTPMSANSASQTHEHITVLNQTNSPLLRLPAELRNQIHAYFFNNALVHVVPRAKQTLSHQRGKYTGPIALHLTCRQLRFETKELFFRNCVFDIGLITMREAAEVLLSSARCNAIESIILERNAMYNIIVQKLHPCGGQLFPALKRVHLHSKWLQGGLDIKATLGDMFGHYDLELESDDRADKYEKRD